MCQSWVQHVASMTNQEHSSFLSTELVQNWEHSGHRDLQSLSISCSLWDSARCWCSKGPNYHEPSDKAFIWMATPTSWQYHPFGSQQRKEPPGEWNATELEGWCLPVEPSIWRWASSLTWYFIVSKSYLLLSWMYKREKKGGDLIKEVIFPFYP